jgi:hypothetical protein
MLSAHCVRSVMGISVVVVYGLAASSLSLAQTSASTASRRQLVQEISDLAYSVPPEFGADALLQIIESGAVEQRDTKLRLLHDVFALAGGSHWRRKMAYFIGPTDTREGWLANAYDLNLDSESLRCRAVQVMIPLDRSEARRLFLEIPPFRIEPHPCKSFLAYDPGILYRTLQLLVKAGFTEAERAKGENFNFFTPFVSSVTSPVQVVPLVKVLVDGDMVSRDQLSVLVENFAVALRGVPVDDRAFRDGYGLIEGLGELTEVCLRSGIACDDVVNAARGYILRNVNAIRCADSLRRETQNRKRAGSGTSIVERFNGWRARFPPYVFREVRAISSEEVDGAGRMGDAPDNPEYWTSPKARALLRGVQELRFGPSQKGSVGRHEPLSVAARKTAEWQVRLDVLLKEFEQWKPEDEKSEIDYFLQKCDIYAALIELIPEGIERDQALRRAVDHLAASGLERDDPVLWFQQANEFVQEVRRSPVTEAALTKRTEGDGEWVVRQLEQSGSMILTLYARLERLRGLTSGPQ